MELGVESGVEVESRKWKVEWKVVAGLLEELNGKLTGSAEESGVWSVQPRVWRALSLLPCSFVLTLLTPGFHRPRLAPASHRQKTSTSSFPFHFLIEVPCKACWHEAT